MKETEPALKVGAVASTVTGLLALIVLLVPDFLSENQLGTIGVVAAFVVPIITAIFTRGQVWSPASVQKAIDEAVRNATIIAKNRDAATVVKKKWINEKPI